MDGEGNGAQEAQESAAATGNTQEQALNPDLGDDAGDAQADVENATVAELSSHASAAFEQQLKARDEEIAKLKAQVADAAKSAEKEEELNARIAELEAKAETERSDFELTLAGCRSTRAGRVLLEDYDGDIAALKAAEPWLFEEKTTLAGVTGLPNAGAASNEESTLAHWRKIAGLDLDN